MTAIENQSAYLAEQHGGLILPAKQRTPEWYQKRAGRITASRFLDFMTRSKRNPREYVGARDAYKHELAVERLSGKAVPGGGSAATLWGNDVEPYGCFAYEAEVGVLCEQIDFVVHPKYPFIGCSPDRLVGADGCMQMKCPFNMGVHLETLLYGMPEEHQAQVQGEQWVLDRAFSDFCSYDPRHTRPNLRLFIQRQSRDNDYIKTLETEALKLNDEVDELCEQILRRFPS